MMEKVNKLTVVTLGLMALGEAVAFVIYLFDVSFIGDIYRGYHLAQVALAIVIAFMIRSEVLGKLPSPYMREDKWRRISLLIPIGLVFSFVGVFFSSGFFYLKFVGGPKAVTAIPFWGISHVLFIIAFVILSPVKVQMKYPKLVSRTRLWVTMMIWPFLSIWLWNRTFPYWSRDIIRYSTVAYVPAVTLMAMTSIWVAYVWRWPGLTVAAGGILLFVSDMILGHQMARNRWLPGIQLAWMAYLAAQLWIMRAPLLAFSTDDPLWKQKAVEYAKLGLSRASPIFDKAKEFILQYKSRILKR